jgi:protein O-GlcNAc transferase
MDFDSIKKLFSSAHKKHYEGNLTDAISAYKQILNYDKRHSESLHYLGIAFLQQGQLMEAQDLIKRSLESKPDQSDAWANLAYCQNLSKAYAAAAISSEKAIALDGENHVAHINLGNANQGLGLLDKAKENFEFGLKLQPRNYSYKYNLATILIKLKNYLRAATILEEVIAENDRFSEAINNLTVCYMMLARYHEALGTADRAINVAPYRAESWSNRAAVLNHLALYNEAIVSCEASIKLDPNYADAWSNQGYAQRRLGSLDESLISVDTALTLEPNHAEAWTTKGNLFYDSGLYEKALSCYECASNLLPDSVESLLNKGNALESLGRNLEALACYNRALMLRKNFANAWIGRGYIFSKIGRYAKAISSYKRALQLEPNSDYLLGKLLHTELVLCDWKHFTVRRDQIRNAAREGRRPATPFQALLFEDDPHMQKLIATSYAESQQKTGKAVSPLSIPVRKEKITLGYFSTDFRDHPVSYLAAELFEQHDRGKFNVVGVYLGPRTESDMQRRLVKTFDRFLFVGNLPAEEIVKQSRQIGIDVAVDMNGYTQGARYDIFASRVAASQISFLGYPGTMGSLFFDYLIADRVVIPKDNIACFSEKIIFMPDCYQPNDSTRLVSTKKFTRESCGLPKDGFIFACFNNNMKILPDIYKCWMRVLDRVPGSILWLFDGEGVASRNLARQASANGINLDRIFFAEKLPMPEHLARITVADLFLDTFPYNAHTTASDALRVGLPVLTCVGETFASRVCASLLSTMKLPELITSSLAEYESVAINLAIRPEALTIIREKLKHNFRRTSLFDSESFAHNIEKAYLKVVEYHRTGVAPRHIWVQ